MLKILHKGIQPSLDIDVVTTDGIVTSEGIPAALSTLGAGKIAAVGSDGKAVLADGQPIAAKRPLGFIINDAWGAFFENKPGEVSGKLPISMGPAVVITDAIDTALTFTPGQLLYCGTGSKVGLVTNVAPATGSEVNQPIGISGSSASSAAPELKIFCF